MAKQNAFITDIYSHKYDILPIQCSSPVCKFLPAEDAESQFFPDVEQRLQHMPNELSSPSFQALPDKEPTKKQAFLVISCIFCCHTLYNNTISDLSFDVIFLQLHFLCTVPAYRHYFSKEIVITIKMKCNYVYDHRYMLYTLLQTHVFLCDKK